MSEPSKNPAAVPGMTDEQKLRSLVLALRFPPSAKVIPAKLAPAFDALFLAWCVLSEVERKSIVASVTPPPPADMEKFYDDTITALTAQVTKLMQSKAAFVAAKVATKPVAGGTQ